MMFDTKVALVIRSDLAEWQKMNVAAFLVNKLSHRCHIMISLYVVGIRKV